MKNKNEWTVYVKGNHFIFYNTVALDRMRICIPPIIFDPLGIIENTCIVQKKNTAVRRTEDIYVEHPTTCLCFVESLGKFPQVYANM